MYEVTVGIPVYKAVDYIEATMESALAQSYPDIEFLVIDDCGDDGSIAVVERLQKEHPRGKAIRLLRNKCNLGVGPSRNRIIDEANGKYLYFLDSDDVIEPHTIDLLVGAAHGHRAEVVYASFEQIDNVSHSSTKQIVYPPESFEHLGDLACYAFRNYGFFQSSVCNCLIDLHFLRTVKLKFIDAVYWEDMAFTYELVTLVERAALLPDITYHYLCRPNSLSNYQERAHLKRDEVLKNVSTIDYLKWKCRQKTGNSYTPYMCYNLEMNSFYIVSHVLKHRKCIIPEIPDADLHQMMQMPMSFGEILRFRHRLLGNLILWAIVKLPTPLFMLAVKIMGRIKKII